MVSSTVLCPHVLPQTVYFDSNAYYDVTERLVEATFLNVEQWEILDEESVDPATVVTYEASTGEEE